MNISQSVEKEVGSMPAGVIFTYNDLSNYSDKPDAVLQAIHRMVVNEKIARFSKGKFYVPTQGLFSTNLKPRNNEILRSMLYKNGERYGYITGALLYNQLKLSTQIPKTITIACKGARQTKDFGSIKVRIIPSLAPVTESNVQSLRFLDALKDIKFILDSEINLSLIIMQDNISSLSNAERKELIKIAEKYYNPQVRALLCLILSNLKLFIPATLKKSLNPKTKYNLGLNIKKWPNAEKWNIK